MNWLKRNIIYLGLLIAGFVLCGILFNQCEQIDQLESDLTASDTFREIEKQQSISRDSIHVEDMKEMKQNLMSEKASRVLLEDEFNRFKIVQSHVRFESKTRIDTMYIPYVVDSTDRFAQYDSCIPLDTVKAHFLPVPKKVIYNDNWFSFNSTLGMEGLTIDSMSMANKFDVTIGWKKPDKPFKFLRRKQPVVELISYNPYTSINYVNNVVVEKKGSIFTSKPAMFMYGGAVVFIGTKLKQ